MTPLEIEYDNFRRLDKRLDKLEKRMSSIHCQVDYVPEFDKLAIRLHECTTRIEMLRKFEAMELDGL